MTERPILFSGPMVRALLDGTKTQTRRILKPQPPSDTFQVSTYHHPDTRPRFFAWKELFGGAELHPSWEPIACPYGQPGDRLWVRETWGVVSNAWDEDGALIDWAPDRPATAIHEMRFGRGYYSGHAIYAADGSYEWAGDDDGGGEPRSAWKPSIHMPRAASRITLEITRVRVERLQDINRGDAMAEGCPFPNLAQGKDPCEWYAELWGQINGPESWAANPWVWVVEFKMVVP